MTYDDFYDNPAYPYDWSENECKKYYSEEPLYETYWVFHDSLGFEDTAMDREDFNSLLKTYGELSGDFEIELAVKECSDYSSHNCFEIE